MDGSPWWRSVGVALVALAGGCALLTGLQAQGVASRGAGGSAITLGDSQQIFHYRQPDAMGLFNVPDMHTAVLRQPDGSYRLWITGNIGPSAGSIARLSTKDFLHYENAGPGGPTRAEPVMEPSCRPPRRAGRIRGPSGRTGVQPMVEASSSSCAQAYDADYVGANAVLTASNGRDLLMFYEAGSKSAGATRISHGWEFNVMALARSTDEGRTWKREGVVLSGTDPRPTSQTSTSQPGISEMGLLVANGYIYAFYQYVPNQVSPGEPQSVIQMARSPVDSNGAPGSWTKYYHGSFSQPGLGGMGSPIVTAEAGGCTRPVEVWPAYSTYLRAYLLTFLCNEGWFLSTSPDLVTWSPPTRFHTMTMWQRCRPMDWNFILVTPGNEAGVLGQTGYVLYARTEARGTGCGGRFSPHELWVRPFTFSGGPAPGD